MKKIFILGAENSAPNYSSAIEACGAQVVYGTDFTDSFGCDALLLVGGADLNPSTYGEENTASEDINDRRDSEEFSLIKHFCEQNKPILGICRGIQILNVALGGSLIQHIEHPEKHSRCGQPCDKVHRVKLSRHSFLTDLYGDDFSVNSAHHQAIKIPADNLEIVAYSEDGIVEAVIHKTKPIIAVQWHPERMAFQHKRDDTVDGKPLFDYFLSLIY